MGALCVATLGAVPCPDVLVAAHEHLQEVICTAVLLGCQLWGAHRQPHGDVRAVRSACQAQQEHRVCF